MIRSIRTAAPALAALLVMAVTACSDNNTTAPSALNDMERNDAIVLNPPGRPTATLTMAVMDYTAGVMVGGATVAFASGLNGTPKNVVDNDASDADKRDGYFKVVMPKATVYSGTVIAALSKYDRIEAMLQVGSTASNVNLGTLSLRTNPLFTVYIRRGSDNVLLGGAKLTVGWADGSAPWMTRLDNLDDMDPTPGRIKFYGKSARTHQICEIQAPYGFLIPTPACKTVWGSWDQKVDVPFLHVIMG